MGIFIVQSSLQLLNAIEANEYFKFEKTLLVLLEEYGGSHFKLLENLLPLYEWDEVIVIKNKRYTSFNQIRLICRLMLIKGWENSLCFSGKAHPHTYLIGGLLKVSQIYFIDDGTATLHIQKEILKGNYNGEIKRYEPTTFLKKMIFTFFSLKEYKRIPSWFTFFKLPSAQGQHILYHNYEYFKKNFSVYDSKDDSIVYFLGSPFSRLKILKLEREIELIKMVSQRYAKEGLKMMYCPHPAALRDKLHKISSELAIPIRKADYPIELDFMMKKQRCVNLATFSSTAIFTLSSMYNPTRLEAFRIPKEDMKISEREKYVPIYDAMKDYNISLIYLTDN